MAFSSLRAVLAAFCLWLAACFAALAEDVTVFAAASMKTALDEIRPLYEAETGDRLTLVYAGSSALARQVGQGAPADVFISANSAWMDRLEDQGLLAGGGRVDLLTNALVIIAKEPAGSIPLNMIGWAEGRVAMGLTNAVPAGIYGREAFEALGLWDEIAPRVVETDNVRAALALVARGEAEFGVVYRSDAVAEPRVAIVNFLPSTAYGKIVYPAAYLKGSSEGGARFVRFLQKHEASAVFRAQGFGLIEGASE